MNTSLKITLNSLSCYARYRVFFHQKNRIAEAEAFIIVELAKERVQTLETDNIL
ncbi:MAG: hypothetical protein ACL7BU_16535 [Candidatus Phlomobacter fragariae]